MKCFECSLNSNPTRPEFPKAKVETLQAGPFEGGGGTCERADRAEDLQSDVKDEK